MKDVRIQGLVRLATRVQQALAAPLPDDHRQHLQVTVERGLQQVHEMLSRHGSRPERLPEPSQRAYRFLAGIDWPTVRTVPIGQLLVRRTETVQLSGFASGLEQVLHRLSRPSTEGEAAAVLTQITSLHHVAEDLILKGRVQPDQLTPQSWAARGWLAYFSARASFDTYVQAVAAAVSILERRSAERGKLLSGLRVYFRPMHGVFRLRGNQLSLPTPAVCLGADDFLALADLVFCRDWRAKKALHYAMRSEPYQAVQAELESLAGVRDESKGAVHDLAASFERVNQRYFTGQMARPKLTWSRTLTGRVFGHYDHLSDRVMVSRTLDQAAAPEFVVDFIVYHELLHKRHGIRWEGGRKLAHTPQFREDEKRFERYSEAEAILKAIARQP